MQAPKYEAPPPDPNIAALNAKTQADDIAAAQTNAQIDTASLMARYGTRLAMAGANQTASPLAIAPTVAPQFGAMR